MPANSVYILTSRAINERTQLDQIANNVANLNTAGYKAGDTTFREYVAREKGLEVGSFNRFGGNIINFQGGPIEHTGNKLDMALQGENTFFAVQGAGGEGAPVEYTRNGQFTMDAQGNLMTQTGKMVLDVNNGPIALPPDSTQIAISRDGTVSNEDGPIAQVGVFEFAPEDLSSLQRTEGSSFTKPDDVLAIVAENYAIVQGSLETSNVNPMSETVRMTEALRAYQSVQRSMQAVEDIEQRSYRTLGRMPQ